LKKWTIISLVACAVLLWQTLKDHETEYTYVLNGIGIVNALVLKDYNGELKLACYDEYTAALPEDYEDEKDLSYIHRQSNIALNKCVIKSYTFPVELAGTLLETIYVPVNVTLPYEAFKRLQQVESSTKQGDTCISASIELIKMCPTLLHRYLEKKEV
jgi:hypothetical protein